MITPIVKATVDCNLDCDYCYEGHNVYKGEHMSQETLDNILTKTAKYNGSSSPTTFIWHGGEPLLMGLSFFERIMLKQKTLAPVNFRNNIQTNGTLLTEPLAKFLSDNKFSVGVSIDGPPHLNTSRHYPRGTAAYKNSLQGINVLRDTCKRDPLTFTGAIAVMTRRTLEDLDGFLDFFLDNQISVRINPIFYEGHGKTVKNNIGISAREYSTAMISIFERWFSNDEDFVAIDPFYEMLGNLIFGSARGCVFTRDCYSQFLEVAPNGDVFPCTGGATSAFRLGNINSDEFHAMLRSPVLQHFKDKRQVALERCHGCEFVNLCNAGCVRKSYMRRRRLDDSDYYCSSYRAIYQHLDRVLVRQLGDNYRSDSASLQADSKNRILRSLLASRTAFAAKMAHYWSDSKWSQWRGNYYDNPWSGDSKCY